MSLRLVGAAAVALMIASCGGGQSGLGDSVAGPSPVVLKDTSPGQLAVSVAVNMGGYDKASRDKTLVDLIFEHNGHPVRFMAGEQVTCDGITLNTFIGSFEGQFATASIAGKTMTCVYRSGGRPTPLLIHVPPALMILSPVDQEHVPIGPHTTIRFQGVLDTDEWVVAVSTKAKAVAMSKDITAAGATLDTSALGTGEGSIALTDPNNFAVEIQGPDFQSVNGTVRRMTMVAVIWVTMAA